ncbi:MAG: fibronectin type III domain-containing protein, partial [Bacteroidetes bacterium]
MAVAGADYYRLDVNTTQDFKGTTVVNNQQVNTNSYEVLNVNAGTIYYYQVRAIAEVSEGSEVASINPATPQMVITKPLALPATAISTVGFTANWQWVHGVDAMALEISTSNTFGTFVTNYPETFTSNTIVKNVTSLTPFITYYYRLKATKGVVEIYSNTVEVRTLPTPPVLLPPTDITATTFKANWDFVAGATAYYIDVANGLPFDSNTLPLYNNINIGIVNSFVVTGLTAGNTYYYRLRAGGGTTISNSSEVDTLITTPSLPTAVSATSTSPTDLTVAWSHTGIGVDGYRIRLVEFPSLNQVASDDITTTTYNFSTLNNTKEYRVFVKAYNADSETGEVFRNALLKPTANDGDNINATGFKATWNAIAGVTNWTVEIATVSNFSPFIPVSATTNEYIFNSLSAGNTYYYRVFATSGSVVSPTSDAVTVVIPAIPAVPTANAVNPLSITTSSFEASWTQVVGCDGYEIDIYKNNTYQSTETAIGANTLTKTISNLPNNSLYTYKVRAYIGNVKSNDSNGIDVFLVPTALEEDTYASGGTGTGFTAKWTTVAVPSSHRLDLFEETPYGNNTYVPVAAYTNIDAGIGGSFPLTDLKFGTNYKYVIRATNGTVTSPNSNEIFALTLPQSPLIDTYDVIDEQSFSLDWATNPSQSATGYALQVFAKGNPVPFYDGYNVGNATSFTLGNTPNPPLSPNTHYLVRLRAVNASGNSSVSGQADVLTLPTTTTATTATEVRYDFTSSSLQFKANWLDDAKGTGDGVITGYKVDVSTDNTFATGVTTITSPTVGLVVNSTNLPTLTGNTVYYYRVKASNASGDALTDSNVMSVLTVPNAPLNVQTTNVQSDKFTVLIPTPTIPNVTSYVLDVATTNNFAPNTYKVINETLNASLVGYTVSNLEAGKLYYYRMRAVNASGASNYSAVRSIITTPVALPAPVEDILTDSFDAQWQEVVGADSYMLQISTQENFATIFDSIPVLAGNAVAGIETKTVNSNLAYLGNYYYRVRAIKNGV